MSGKIPDPPPVGRSPVHGPVIPHQPKWHQKLAARLIWSLLHASAATLHFKLDDPHGIVAQPSIPQVIVCIWHNRLALCLFAYHRYLRQRDKTHRLAAMVSASRDGALLAYLLELFDVAPVRGSSSRRGPQALRELTRWAKDGLDLAITPDGPRGPRYVVQDGVIALAQLSGLPILPASIHLPRKWELKSWDRFQVPVPFSNCTVSIGPLLSVPREASHEERVQARARLEQTLRALTID